MKILMVNDFKEVSGGAEISMYEMKAHLEKRGHIVEIFSGDLEFKKFSDKKSLRRLLILLFNFKYLSPFKNKLKHFKPDIIHVHNIFNELSPSFLILLKNYPVFMSVHDNQLFSPVARQNERTGKYCKNKICRGCTNCVGIKGSIYEYIKRSIYKPLMQNIDFYIGTSKYINKIIEELHIGKALTINHGVTLLPYSQISQNYNLLYLGRLSKEKGIDCAIKAFSEVLLKFPKAHFTIVGEGEYKQHLEILIKKLGLEKNITFTGKIEPTQVQKYYKDSTIVVVPSLWDEPFGKVGVEAMSAGRPVIASKVGGIPEWLDDGQTGFLVEPGNEGAMAEKINLLFSNTKLLEEMSKNARNKSQEFSIEKYIDKLTQFYSNAKR